ncbi:MAG: hypothetical protein JSU70_11900 [Phycisphaerales bacterium]|nr:MAG: hypothetical protein JSU70_11900 [Phycisphaerales bacterium]
MNGLRCGLTVDPEDPAIGSDFYVQMQFENLSGEPLEYTQGNRTHTVTCLNCHASR